MEFGINARCNRWQLANRFGRIARDLRLGALQPDFTRFAINLRFQVGNFGTKHGKICAWLLRLIGQRLEEERDAALKMRLGLSDVGEAARLIGLT